MLDSLYLKLKFSPKIRYFRMVYCAFLMNSIDNQAWKNYFYSTWKRAINPLFRCISETHQLTTVIASRSAFGILCPYPVDPVALLVFGQFNNSFALKLP